MKFKIGSGNMVALEIITIFLLFGFLVTPSLQIWKLSKPSKGQVKIVLLPFVSLKAGDGKAEIIYKGRSNTSEEYDERLNEGTSNQNDFQDGETFLNSNTSSPNSENEEIKNLPDNNDNYRVFVQSGNIYRGANQENFQVDDTKTFERGVQKQNSPQFDNLNAGFAQPVIQTGFRNEQKYNINTREPAIVHILTEQQDIFNNPEPVQAAERKPGTFYQNFNRNIQEQEQNFQYHPRNFRQGNQNANNRNIGGRLNNYPPRNIPERGFLPAPIIKPTENFNVNIDERKKPIADGYLRIPISGKESLNNFQNGGSREETAITNLRQNTNNQGRYFDESGHSNDNNRNKSPPFIIQDKNINVKFNKYNGNEGFLVRKNIQVQQRPLNLPVQGNQNTNIQPVNLGNSASQQSPVKPEENSKFIVSEERVIGYAQRYIPESHPRDNNWKPMQFGVQYRGAVE
ncbi:GATA zinc finger domain-containing protein 14-like [Centruroides sculpturatus]|uniref:GATA zinc finger domain-containing protein 14-like n=1 Tax=Centruroides sculpturatus TaxID=218467 RepID=UPI000C6EBC4F|nr:GATA zinc finger domain-containing protein 14-like [Centruroides sculpturatus]